MPDSNIPKMAPPEDQGKSVFSAERLKRHIQSRFNPIRNLEPMVLVRHMESFESGYLRDFSILMDKIERRDDVLVTVAAKRKADAAKIPWEVVTIGELDPGQEQEAESHKEALMHFYNNVVATDALDRNITGGFRMLVKQMMDAVGKGYAAHEIIWSFSGDKATARFNFVPLWFFENTTGRLRFLQNDYALEGEECPSGSWMITCGGRIMEACAVAYMFKHLPLKDWLIYCQDFGRPIVEGITDADKDSTEWEQMVDAVEAVTSDLRIVHSKSGEIKITDLANKGNQPHPALVERMDRALSAIWRGADLSTMSAGQGAGDGASLQGDESDILNEDDLAMLTDTLNHQVDPWVIQYLFGPGVKPLAYIQIKAPQKEVIETNIRVDEFLRNSGAPLSIRDTMERYNRPMPEEGEDLLQATQAPVMGPGGFNQFANESNQAQKATEKLQQNIRTVLAKAVARDLAPIRSRLDGILRIQNPDIFENKLREFLADLPQLVSDINADPDAARVLEQAMAAALANGFESIKIPNSKP